MSRTHQLLRIGFTATALAVSLAAFGVARADAAVDPKNPCNISGWFVNGDEGAREPVRKLAGFEFENTDLIHHATNFPLRFLRPGWFSATPAPDQSSFFSVEVRDLTTDAYGTLRWNKTTAKWDLVTKVAGVDYFHSHADPADFIGTDTKWGKLTAATRVVTFGVGYTNSPAGTVKTTVTVVGFMGTSYKLYCPKEVDPSPSPTATPSNSPTSPSPTATTSSSPSASATSSSPSPSSTRSPSSPSPSASSTRTSPVPVPNPADGDGSDLPVTGASLPLIVGGGVILLIAGVAALAATRYRKTKGTTIDHTRDDEDNPGGGSTYYSGGRIL